MRTPFGEARLARYPLRRRETLRAWDAADEYLLDELAGLGLGEGTRLLILNDSFGALAVSLAALAPSSQGDSYTAHWSLRENLLANGWPTDSVRVMTPLDGHRGEYDLVLVRVPKTLSLLEEQLLRLKPHLHGASRVIGLGMARQIHTSTLALFEAIVGPTHTSLARKKARLIFSRPDPGRVARPSPYPSCYPLEGRGYRICNHAGVFSRERLDIGTRLLLGHIPADPGLGDIVDLGCGNGVLGLLAAEANPRARLHFTDESYLALASARDNYQRCGSGGPAEFLATDCLMGLAPESADLILCNPPFHQQQTVGDFIAWRMFRQAGEVLRRGGALRIVGNRHLNYHVKLKRLFGNLRQVAANPKFVVLEAIRE
ncbi:MAG: 50S rRNA methyltransferase [Candidatus Sedimenticola endophacoides]|uniref:Ribosomal RNA large subunit methyltransferase G n=1 Tax=Candidatus Sedimenticola endophacoides TaxID=2548426 RepID=A0A6N4DWE9_9GAMM|nr:MAG: 50S rRNA methyltransferase [Candidatus Sedimenticola endophacoides]OQX36639.1 MAG: 50S rRNA methyltransferase [Candidatus Sedimenticola endophacoides]OQX41583.1 MAG: 50S rRNA methyltransferase [Candidatus Sedimenticola endophacoides]OQX46184.1 MAG: 50S rRNA methyltransferase [Candidatus Sedimenticola endophacoides]PUE01427.1 MAG: 50S rRNA methyltransferase [Candidatus Sedimenticola endophacoides]